MLDSCVTEGGKNAASFHVLESNGHNNIMKPRAKKHLFSKLSTHEIKWLCRWKGLLLSGFTAFDTTSDYLSPSSIRRNFGFVAV